MTSINQFKNLVICGGGIKAYSLNGSFKALNNLDKMKYIEKISGTSAGALYGVFVACKCTNKEIDEYTVKFYDELTTYSEGAIQQGYNMFNKLGLHDNKNIYNVVDNLLFDKFGQRKMTMKQLYDQTKIEFTTVATCLTTGKAVYMNYITLPDIEVAEAVMMSTAIPFYFVQVKWHGMVYCDGGTVDNFSIDYYDYANGRFNNETLGLHFKEAGSENPHNETDSVLKLLTVIENAELENNEAQSIQQYDKRFIVEINVGNVKATDFDLTEKQKQMLLTNGYNAVVNFFAKYDATVVTDPVTTRTWSEYLWSWIVVKPQPIETPKK